MAATITEALERLPIQSAPVKLPPQESLQPTEPDLLAQVDLTQSLSADEYKQQLREEQTRFGKLQQSIYEDEIPVLVLFEGWDAAGKGGAIKRLTDILDPRSYTVNAFAARQTKKKPTTTCGGSGGGCQLRVKSAFAIAVGMVECSSSESKDLLPNPNGAELIRKSTNLRSNSPVSVVF